MDNFSNLFNKEPKFNCPVCNDELRTDWVDKSTIRPSLSLGELVFKMETGMTYNQYADFLGMSDFNEPPNSY